MDKLTPGQRAKHWASAFMTLWPAWLIVFSALGYTNKDEISGILFSGDKKIVGLTPFEAYVREEIERIDSEEAVGRAAVEDIRQALKRQDRVNYQVLSKKLDEQEKQLTILNGLVD